jgi:hypothetical protein
MRIKELTPGDTFLTDSGIKWQLLLINKAEQKKYKNMFKARRLDTSEEHYIDNLIIRKI